MLVMEPMYLWLSRSNTNVCAARHINAPAVVIGIDIIDAAVAHELRRVEHFVRLGVAASWERTSPAVRPMPATATMRRKEFILW